MHWVLDPVIRWRAKLHEMPLDRVRVRVATTEDEYEQSFRLVQEAYKERGWESVLSGDMRILPQHLLPETTVLVALEEDKVIGTMSLVEDSSVGIPSDATYHDEIQRLRSEGCRIVEYSCLGVAKPSRHLGIPKMLNLAGYHIAHHIRGCSHCVVSVHPKAYKIYRALFGFRPLAPPRQHTSLDMHVIGIYHDMGAETQAFVKRHYRKRLDNRLLLFDYFMNECPSSIELPPQMNDSEWVRYKLPREVFQQLFIEKTDTLASLTDTFRSYVGKHRTKETLEEPNQSEYRFPEKGLGDLVL